MTNRGLKLASVGVVLGMTIVALVALYRLPPGAQLPTHWNAAGEVDRRMSAPGALFFGIGMSALLSLVLAVVPALEPNQARRDAGAPVLRAAWAGLLVLMVAVEGAVVAPAFGWHLPTLLPLAGAGLLLIVIGNVLPKSRPGFFVGIRTPWTLTDPENWIATHRLGSRTMMLGGATIVAAAVLPLGAGVRQALIMAAVVVAALPPLIFSWWFWRRRAAHR
ncbi:SdpI family protein [Sphingomonas sp. RP10(2022)]|uniref:SdpI family protein n=1 Tax=Sphingomonas liriopis TaxID=2949094 RepID=A0A9X2HRH0_9SPHN|nr:SdpI family protein [Sphingomonas liriopis]MCP3734114.1 SdpI family protein [Sphingomonas liriopis]